ncbi:MAG: hypothetical protein N2Z74_08825, partial [Syntrophales bacterium]|nr:hypothetical protein [Syntrophales bacterium]
IHLLLDHPEKGEEVFRRGVLDCLTSPALRALAVEIRQRMVTGGSTDVSSLLETVTDEGIRLSLTAALVRGGPWEDSDIAKFLDDAVRRLKAKWYRRRHQELRRELIKAQETGDEEACQRLLVEKTRLLKEETANT